MDCNGAHPALLLLRWSTSDSQGARHAATLAYEKVCSKAPKDDVAAEPEKPTAMIVHGLLGSG